MALNDGADLGELARARARMRARREIACRQACRRVSAGARAARGSSARAGAHATTAESAPRPRRRRGSSASACISNITQPDASTPPSGRTTASSASAGELEAHGRQQPQRERGERRRRRSSRARGGPRARSRRQPVAAAPDRLEVAGPRGVVLDLRAQPAHVDGDGARVERRGVAPDVVHQLVAGEDAVGVGRRGTRAGRTRAWSARSGAPRLARLAAAGVDRRGRRTRSAPPSVPAASAASTALTRATSSRGRERLRQVVVGADLEPGQAVGLLAERGDHDHRQLRARPDPAAERQPVDARQHQVEDDEARRLLLRAARAPCRRRRPASVR